MKKRKLRDFVFWILLVIMLLFCMTMVLAYPMPTAIIGELSGEGSSNAYVYVTAFDLEDGTTLYYNSFQSDSQGRFVDVLSLDQSLEFMIQVQLLPQGGDLSTDGVVYSFNNLQAGDDQYIEHIFSIIDPNDGVEEDSPTSSSSSSSSGGGGSSDNVVGRVIEIPDLDEIKETDQTSSPLTEEQEEELQDLIENGVDEEIEESNSYSNQESESLSEEENKNVFEKLIPSMGDIDPVAVVLLSSMIMIFATILILLVLPESEKSSKEEEEKAKLINTKPINERNLSLHGEGGFTDSLDSKKEVKDLNENSFSFVGDKNNNKNNNKNNY
jgi:hypothetical protein